MEVCHLKTADHTDRAVEIIGRIARILECDCSPHTEAQSG